MFWCRLRRKIRRGPANGARGESFPGQAAEAFGRLWKVRSSRMWMSGVAYGHSNNGLAEHIREPYSSTDP
eukprot:351748-Chlamydomonas_euryale.AAC.3